MSDKKVIFNNIGTAISSSIRSFQCQFGREPNKLLMSQDVFDFITSYSRDLSLYLDDEKNSFMGMDVEVITYKKGFIEVGYYVHNTITVNVSEGGGEDE